VDSACASQKDKPVTEKYDVLPTQSVELLKELHILTRDGKLNQDSRRKLKQVFHLVQFIEPLMRECLEKGHMTLVDHGAGKSYLGFLLNDLFCKLQKNPSQIIGIDSRSDLVKKSQDLAQKLNFKNMVFIDCLSSEAQKHPAIPQEVDIVTALHACNTASDDAIRFGLEKKAKFMVLVPCCQAEVAAALRQTKGHQLKNELSEIWRRPLHTREFGSHITNVLRCLQLESHGYEVTVTELIGWEHSMKNELIIASYRGGSGASAARRKDRILEEIGLTALAERFA